MRSLASSSFFMWTSYPESPLLPDGRRLDGRKEINQARPASPPSSHCCWLRKTKTELDGKPREKSVQRKRGRRRRRRYFLKFSLKPHLMTTRCSSTFWRRQGNRVFSSRASIFGIEIGGSRYRFVDGATGPLMNSQFRVLNDFMIINWL